MSFHLGFGRQRQPMLQYGWGDEFHIFGCDKVASLQQREGFGRLYKRYRRTRRGAEIDGLARACLMDDGSHITQQRRFDIYLAYTVTESQSSFRIGLVRGLSL